MAMHQPFGGDLPWSSLLHGFGATAEKNKDEGIWVSLPRWISAGRPQERVGQCNPAYPASDNHAWNPVLLQPSGNQPFATLLKVGPDPL